MVVVAAAMVIYYSTTSSATAATTILTQPLFNPDLAFDYFGYFNRSLESPQEGGAIDHLDTIVW